MNLVEKKKLGEKLKSRGNQWHDIQLTSCDFLSVEIQKFWQKINPKEMVFFLSQKKINKKLFCRLFQI